MGCAGGTSKSNHDDATNTDSEDESPTHEALFDRARVLALITGSSYYLDAVSGNDTTGDGSSEHPWQTLEKAQSIVKDGDGVFLRDGNYGAFQEDTAGRSDWVVYLNDEGHVPVMTNISSRFDTSRDVYLVFYGIHIAPAWVDPAGDAAWQAEHPGSTDPQYAQSEGGTYVKTASPVNALHSDHLMFINCEMLGTNKHLTSYGINLSFCNDVVVSQCQIQRVSRGIVYQNGARIQVLHNHIHDITSTFIGSGAYCSEVLIEGNNGHDSTWSMTDDWCPRSQGHTYHASFVSIRSSDVSIRGNIFHNGGTSSTFMLYDDPDCPAAYQHILIENNLVYDPQNQTGLRLYRLGDDVVIRNNILVGRQRYDGPPGPVQYGTVFALSGVADGYDGSGLSVYNNIFVGMAAFGRWFDAIHEGNNIFWSVLTTPDDVWTFLSQSELVNGSKVLTSRDGIAPDYFTAGFFNGELDFSWTAEGTDPQVPHGHGKILDYTYAEGGEAVGFGDPEHQPADSLGTLDGSGLLRDDGNARDQDHHSAGCYEP
jgi:hypothetical protein